MPFFIYFYIKYIEKLSKKMIIDGKDVLLSNMGVVSKTISLAKQIIDYCESRD